MEDCNTMLYKVYAYRLGEITEWLNGPTPGIEKARRICRKELKSYPDVDGFFLFIGMYPVELITREGTVVFVSHNQEELIK